MEAIDFYNANKTIIVQVPRPGHPEDPSGWKGIRQCGKAGDFAKDALVMSLADACDFAEKYAEQRADKAEARLKAVLEKVQEFLAVQVPGTQAEYDTKVRLRKELRLLAEEP